MHQSKHLQRPIDQEKNLNDIPDQNSPLPQEIPLPPATSYHLELPHPSYSLGWSRRPDRPLRFAYGSFLPQYENSIGVVEYNPLIDDYQVICSSEYPYPASKVCWIPDINGTSEDLFATAGDYLRLWSVGDLELSMLSLFSQVPPEEYCAPLTSLDWFDADPALMATTTYDSTCSLWDISKGDIIHAYKGNDGPLNDIAFNSAHFTLGTVSQSGILDVRDLRQPTQHSILYKDKDSMPLTRLSWNSIDPNLCLIISGQRAMMTVLDIRYVRSPLIQLQGHSSLINGAQWNPSLSSHIMSWGQDGRMLLWDISISSDLHPNDAMYCSIIGQPVHNAAFNPNNNQLIMYSHGDTISITNI